MKTIKQHEKKVLDDFESRNFDVIKTATDIRDRLNVFLEEFKSEADIPENSEYWDIKTEAMILKSLADRNELPKKNGPETKKDEFLQTYRSLKYGARRNT